MATKIAAIILISLVIFALLSVVEALKFAWRSRSHKYLRRTKRHRRTYIKEDKL